MLLGGDSLVFHGSHRKLSSDLRISSFPGGSVVKNLPANVGDTEDVGLIPALGRTPGVRNGNPLQYFCLENSMHNGAWQATVHGVEKQQGTTEHTHMPRFQGLTLYCFWGIRQCKSSPSRVGCVCTGVKYCSPWHHLGFSFAQ